MGRAAVEVKCRKRSPSARERFSVAKDLPATGGKFVAMAKRRENLIDVKSSGDSTLTVKFQFLVFTQPQYHLSFVLT